MEKANVTLLPDFRAENPELYNAIRKVVPPTLKVYLVGGAVRDILLGRPVRDYDFCVEGLVRPIGKSIANELNGAYYVLDDEREMVRVIIYGADSDTCDVDIALLSGNSIQDDLRERDFTINAMAIELGSTPRLIDPLNGLFDLHTKTLRMCSPESLHNDPLRALRAIRMCLEFDMTMDSALLGEMFSVSRFMHQSSYERHRDELFKIIKMGKNRLAVRLLRKFDFLDFLFPDCLKENWEERINSIASIDMLFALLCASESVRNGDDFFSACLTEKIGNYRHCLYNFFEKALALYHTRHMLLCLGMVERVLSDNNARQMLSWNRNLTLSTSESSFITYSSAASDFLLAEDIVASWGDIDTYRYFLSFKEGGIGGVLLYLAHLYAESDTREKFERWTQAVNLAEKLLSDYFSRYNEVIAPVAFLSGNDIQTATGLAAGPIIGKIKKEMLEAQVMGFVSSVDEARSFVKKAAAETNQDGG